MQANPTSRPLLRQRDFLAYLIGQATSALGDVVTQTALPLLVLSLTGSATAVGAVGFLQSLPTLLVAVWAGALADRWDRRRMMVGSDVARTLLSALIPLSVVLHGPTLAVVYAVALPLGALHNLFEAASLACVPSLVGRERVVEANGLFQAFSSAALLAGPALAALLSGWIGPGLTLSVDALSFLVSFLTVASIRAPLQGPPAAAGGGLWHEVREGVRYLRGHPALRRAMLFWSAVTLLSAPLIPVVTYDITITLHRRPADFGWVVSAFCVGMGLGALLTPRLGRALGRGLLPLGAGLFGSGLAALASLPARGVQLPLAAVTGAGLSAATVAFGSLRAELTPDAVLGRVSSLGRVMTYGLNPLALLAGGLLTDRLGAGAVLRGIGALVVLVSAGYGLTLADG